MFNLNQVKHYYINSPMWMKKIYSDIPFDFRNGAEYRKWKKLLHVDQLRTTQGGKFKLIVKEYK